MASGKPFPELVVYHGRKGLFHLQRIGFPFSQEMEDFYSDPSWHTRIGLGHIAQALLLRERDIVAMLSFYGDGSGEHRQGSMVIAGYLGSAIDMWELERLWDIELKTPPKIDFFKASQCKPDDTPPRLSGQFQGWDLDAAREKRHRLASIIHHMSPRLVAVRSAIRWDEYDSSMGDAVVKAVLNHAYFPCLHGVISAVLRTAINEPKGIRVSFTFDIETNGTVDQEAKLQYDFAAAKSKGVPDAMKDRMGAFSQSTDIATPLLQPSDLLTWSIRRQLEGFPSPVLHLVRDEQRLHASIESDPRPSGFAQMVVDLEEEYHKKGFI